MKNEPLWQSLRRPRYEPLQKSGKFDVVVIGGGITGMTAAYLLKQAGKKVCVVERRRIGGVDSGYTTAHLTYVTDERLPQLVKHFGEDVASLAWEAGSAAIDTIESIVKREKIACDFRLVPGFLHAAIHGSQDESSALQKDAKQAVRIGYSAKFLAAVPYLKKPGVRFPDCAKFHPLKYISALAKRVHGDGSLVCEDSEASEVQDDPYQVIVGKYKLRCDYVVIGTHVPLMGKNGLVSATLFQTKIFPYSSYAIGATVPKDLLPEACFWDTADPYHYLRVERGQESDYVIFGGADHKTGQETDTSACFARLEQSLRTIIPQAKPDRRWSGQVIETNDGLPYIGETAERQFVGTGYSGNGMTFGTVAGMMARDAVLGHDNLWQKLFSVDRKHVRGGTWDYVTENLDYPYYYVKDRISHPQGTSVDDVAPGEGKVLNIDGQRVACARAKDGTLSVRSAVCTHMGCLVRWNGAEQTWDCPCHGSRFLASGEVLGGPAETPLEEVKIAAAKKSPQPAAAKVAKKTAKKKTAKKSAKRAGQPR